MRIFLGVSLLALVACNTTIDPAPQVAARDGRPVFETSCTINHAAVGGKALWGANKGKRNTDYYSCQPQANATCPTGYKILSKDKGVPERRVDTIRTGTMITRQTSILQKVTIRYQCTA